MREQENEDRREKIKMRKKNYETFGRRIFIFKGETTEFYFEEGFAG